MLPLLPFALGLLAGGLAVRSLRNARLRDGLQRAQDKVRSATVSGLAAVENSAHAMKQRLETAPAAESGAAEAASADTDPADAPATVIDADAAAAPETTPGQGTAT